MTLFLLQEAARTVVLGPTDGVVETSIINLVQWLRLIAETTGAVIICLGVVIAGATFVKALVPPQVDSFNRIRLVLARYLALALELGVTQLR